MSGNLTTTPEGDLVIPADKLGKLKGAPPESLRIASLFDDLLVCGHAQPGDRPSALMYGDLRLFHVGELMALISSMRRDGYLSLFIPHARKTVYFSGGEIVYATSTVEDDRLGEILWRRGFLDLEQLYEVHDLVTPQKKLGAILVERKLITPRQLYEGIKEQVQEIVYSTFHFRRGEFLFVEGKVPVKGRVRLDAGTKEVIMEGIHRIEEMTRLEELFPDRGMLVVPRPVMVDAKLAEPERHVHKLIDGKRTVDAIIAASHLGEYEALKAMAKLRRVGVVDVREQAVEEMHEESPLPAVIKAYTRMLRYIHQTLKAEESGGEVRVESYLGSPAPKHIKIFANVGFDSDGRLDMDTLFRNARQSSPDDSREVAMGALRSLYDYAVFQAMDVLDDDACDQMMAKLQKMRSKLDDEEE
jgi:hypothetical protein